MNEITKVALHDELEKISVSIDQLQRGYRRLGIMRLPKVKGSLKDSMLSAIRGERPSLAAGVALGGGVGTIPAGRSAAKAIGQQNAALYRSTGSAGKIDSSVLGALKSNFRESRTMKQHITPKKPVILASKGGASKALAEMGGKRLTPEARKALNLVIGHHEGFERAALSKGRIRFGFGHANPSVLAKEHNLLATLKGPGAAEAREALQQVRSSVGDSSALSKSLERMFGPRAALEYGAGAKIPKAMRKRLERGVPLDIWGRMPSPG